MTTKFPDHQIGEGPHRWYEADLWSEDDDDDVPLTAEENRQLIDLIHSKHDQYQCMTINMGLWLPREKDCPKDFLNDIMNNRKQVFKASQINKKPVVSNC